MSAQNNNLNDNEEHNLFCWERRLRKQLKELRLNIMWNEENYCASSPVKEPTQSSIMDFGSYFANAENQNYDSVTCRKIKNFIEKHRRARDGLIGPRKRICRSIVMFENNRQIRGQAKKNEVDVKISELISQLPKVNITDNSAVDFNIVTGISRLSCYDKTPRQPALNIEDGNSLNSNADLTQKLSNIHFGPSSSNDIERTVQSSSICESIEDLEMETKPGILPDETYDIGLGRWKL